MASIHGKDNQPARKDMFFPVVDGFLMASRYFSSLLFLGLTSLCFILQRENPFLPAILAVFLFILGLCLLIYGLSTVEKYKTVFDYQPTTFWKRETNGKHAREVLTAINTVGIWSLLSSLAIVVINLL